jgi:Asp/Glu/hydantoin racemase
MQTTPRVSLIHATSLAVNPITQSFRRLWPEAQIYNLLDDSLTADLQAHGKDIAAMTPRFETLTRYAIESGAHGVLFTCSAFGPAIEAARNGFDIPVLKPNEAMIGEALGVGTKIGLVATFEPAIAPILKELQDAAGELGKRVEPEAFLVNDAWAALQGGDHEKHDQLIVEACAAASGCDVVCFAQFSMTSAAAAAQRTSGRPTLTTPDSAVNRLKSLILQ